jgi:deazaflavin-dependent oxidoreductase (nitroreductase family)
MLAATGPVAWLLARTLHHLDRAVFRLTGGKHTFVGLAAGLPVLMLTTTGAKTGQRRTSPVLAFPDGDAFILIATNYGQGHDPGWVHNLRQKPCASVTFEGLLPREMTASELTGKERERVFEQGLTIYHGFGAYRKRTTRTIPVLRPEPHAALAGDRCQRSRELDRLDRADEEADR